MEGTLDEARAELAELEAKPRLGSRQQERREELLALIGGNGSSDTAEGESEPQDGSAAASAETPGGELVVTDPFEEIEVFSVLDRHDEDMILRELEKLPLDKVLVYEFPLDGEKVIDLSYEGVREAVLQMVSTGKVAIKVDPGSMTCDSVTEDIGNGPEACWQATVYAEATVPGREGVVHGQFGTFIQPKVKPIKPGTAERYKKEDKTVIERGGKFFAPNPFARQTGLGKAQRNALKLFIPVRIRRSLIARAKNDAAMLKTIAAGAGAEKLAELPPPLTDDKARDLKKQAEGLYDELRALNPRAVTPAAYHTYLTRAEHSHERLEDFLGYLRDAIAANAPVEGTAEEQS